MKNKAMIALLLLLCMVAFSGCNSQDNNDQAESSAPNTSESSTEAERYSNDEYLILRNIFVDKYRTTMDSVQKAVSSFNLSEEWWNNYKSLHTNANTMSDAFLKNSDKVPYDYVTDFTNIKDEIEKYSAAMNKIEEAYGKSADEQAVIIAEGVKNMNNANADWKNKISD